MNLTRIESNTHLILFLGRTLEDFPHHLVIESQSLYYVPAELMGYEYIIEHENLELGLQPVVRRGGITVTIGDFIEITRENNLLE